MRDVRGEEGISDTGTGSVVPRFALHPQERSAAAVLCEHRLKRHQPSEGVLGAVRKGFMTLSNRIVNCKNPGNASTCACVGVSYLERV